MWITNQHQNQHQNTTYAGLAGHQHMFLFLPQKGGGGDSFGCCSEEKKVRLQNDGESENVFPGGSALHVAQ